MAERIVSKKEKAEDRTLDLTLRPKVLKDYVGQEKIKENLKISLAAAKKRKEPLDHTLLYGGPGLGKTTLAHIIAREMGVNVKVTSGPAIERAGDLGAILTNLENNDVLFIDEIHRLNKAIEEILYSSMEENVLDVILGKGPSARTLRLELPPFTLIGATTRVNLLTSPLRNRFGITYHLNFYNPEEIKAIIKRSAEILAIALEEEAAEEIAKRSRGTPRIANRLLKRVRDYTQVKGDGKINTQFTEEAFQMLEIDELGLDLVDRKIIDFIINKFGGGPVGLGSIAAVTGEERDTVEDIYEPYLLQLGFLMRTSRGRVVTPLAYKHLKIVCPENYQAKFSLNE